MARFVWRFRYEVTWRWRYFLLTLFNVKVHYHGPRKYGTGPPPCCFPSEEKR